MMLQDVTELARVSITFSIHKNLRYFIKERKVILLNVLGHLLHNVSA